MTNHQLEAGKKMIQHVEVAGVSCHIIENKASYVATSSQQLPTWTTTMSTGVLHVSTKVYLSSRASPSVAVSPEVSPCGARPLSDAIAAAQMPLYIVMGIMAVCIICLTAVII